VEPIACFGYAQQAWCKRPLHLLSGINRLFRLRSTSLVQTPASLVEWNQLLVSATLNKPGANARFAC